MRWQAAASHFRQLGHRSALAFFVAGLLMLQVAWITAVPTFRGTDEIDHSYRAASVVRGQVGPSYKPVPSGRGSEVRVPHELVKAASPACAELQYVGRGNCHPVAPPDDAGLVGIASSAAQYLPLYHATVGWPSLLLEGATGQYGMRVISIVLCDLVLILAAAIALRRSPWIASAVLVCLTPTVLYATVIVAPNGLSMVAGLLMWVAWMSIDPHRAAPRNRRLLYVGAAAAILCCLTHDASPIWVLVTIVAVAVTTPTAAWRTVGRHAVVKSLAGIFGAMLVALVWNLATGVHSTEGELHKPTSGPPLIEVGMLPVRWLFQSIFGAPRPGGMTSGIVYGLAFLMIFLVCAGGFVRARRVVRRAMVGIALVLVVLPSVLTWLTYDDLGFAWQGRYAIPLGVGITLLAASTLHGTPFGRLHLLGMAALAVVAAGSLISAVSNVLSENAELLVPTWMPPTLGALGVSLWAASLALATRRSGRVSLPPGSSGEPATQPQVEPGSHPGSLAPIR